MRHSLFRINPPVIAHRGASGIAPENTLIAFTKAAQMGIKWIEFDVMLASDDTPIVFHDETLRRTTGEKGKVITYPYAYLSTLDAGAWFSPKYAGERIPSLEQVMEWLKMNNMCANIEIKSNPGQESLTVERAFPIINHYFPQPNPSILFSSFDLESLRALRRLMPACHLGFLMHQWQENWRELCAELECVTVNAHHEIMTDTRARDIILNGQQIYCYTVNSINRANELFAMGVNGVFSDVPDKILAVVAN